MLSLPITYKDFNGVTRKETFEFNLSPAELAEMEMVATGNAGYQAFIQRVTDARDTQTLMAEFKKFIRHSVGRRSVDGRRFDKSDEIADDFENSGAYSPLFMRLVTNADFASTFVNGVAGDSAKAAAAQATAAALPQDHKPKASVLSVEDVRVPAPTPQPELIVDQPTPEDEAAWGLIEDTNPPTTLGVEVQDTSAE